jgi:diguanylate cyclase (GGDEF)-like protein
VIAERAIETVLEAATAAETRIAELQQRVAELERLAVTDELTGLLNRRGFEAEINRALAAAQRYQETGTLIYVDLDGFKRINDTHGHAAGDEVLRQVARVLMENIRNSDHVGRLGGDEFVILFPRTQREDGIKRAETLERLLNSTLVNWQGHTIQLKASLGFQPFGMMADGRRLLHMADHSMYRTKRQRAEGGGKRAAA